MPKKTKPAPAPEMVLVPKSLLCWLAIGTCDSMLYQYKHQDFFAERVISRRRKTPVILNETRKCILAHERAKRGKKK